jgi:hypothetical protein
MQVVLAEWLEIRYQRIDRFRQARRKRTGHAVRPRRVPPDRDQGKCVEAEPLLRESLAIADKASPMTGFATKYSTEVRRLGGAVIRCLEIDRHRLPD